MSKILLKIKMWVIDHNSYCRRKYVTRKLEEREKRKVKGIIEWPEMTAKLLMPGTRYLYNQKGIKAAYKEYERIFRKNVRHGVMSIGAVVSLFKKYVLGQDDGRTFYLDGGSFYLKD